MTDIVDMVDSTIVGSDEKAAPMARGLSTEELAAELLARADGDAVRLVGPGGLLGDLTKRVLEAALEAEMTEHVGYEPYDPAGHHSGNSRNGTRSKTVVTDIGPISIDVPRDRAGSFEPVMVPKRKRRLGGVDQMVLSVSAKGLTHGEISAHLAEIYGAKVSKETVTRITDGVIDTMVEWQNRPLDAVYPVVFIDAIHVKIREGQVANRPTYVAIGVTVDGERDILGLWAGGGGEGAKYWAHVLTEIKNRGTRDVCILVCDGLTGLPEVVGNVWPQATVQTCIIHLIRINRPSGAGQGVVCRATVRRCCSRAVSTRWWRSTSVCAICVVRRRWRGCGCRRVAGRGSRRGRGLGRSCRTVRRCWRRGMRRQ